MKRKSQPSRWNQGLFWTACLVAAAGIYVGGKPHVDRWQFALPLPWRACTSEILHSRGRPVLVLITANWDAVTSFGFATVILENQELRGAIYDRHVEVRHLDATHAGPIFEELQLMNGSQAVPAAILFERGSGPPVFHGGLNPDDLRQAVKNLRKS